VDVKDFFLLLFFFLSLSRKKKKKIGAKLKSFPPKFKSRHVIFQIFKNIQKWKLQLFWSPLG